MAFSYNDKLSADRDKVRLYIADTVNGAGPKPNDVNFADAELDGLIAAEGIWQRAVAAAYEALAAAWRRYPSFATEGLRLDRTAIANGYATQAQEWRQRYGSAVAGTSRVGSRDVTRRDGYSIRGVVKSQELYDDES